MTRRRVVRVPLTKVMEKNNKKRRVTRIKSGFDDIEDGCRDYLSSIIKDMDSNFKTVQPSKLYRSKKTIVSLTEPVSNVKDTPSSSKAQVNTSKSKNFGIARKFPLMEKSQKILKHIKHNQRIPKQRAHLASFSDTPPVRKKINHDNLNKNSRHSSSDKNSKHSNPETFKISTKVDKHEVNKKPCTSTQSAIENHNSNGNTVNYSEGDTTDSEYERFVKKNKKNVKKKSSKRKSNVNKNTVTKSYKKARKTTESQYQSSDDDTASSTSEYKKRKRPKSLDHKKKKDTPLLSESESDVINDETFTRHTSSDSDMADDTTVTNNSVDSEFVESKENEHCLTPEPHPLNIENVITNTGSEYSLCNFSVDKTITNDTQVSMEHFEQNTVPSDCSSVDNKATDGKCDAVMSYDFPVLSLPENCDNRVTTNEAQLDQEESDIEIVDVVVPSSANTTIGSNKAKKNKDLFTENFVKSPHSAKANGQQDSHIQLKVEGAKQPTKQLNNKANDSDVTKKNEAVYITNICGKHNEETDCRVNSVKQSKSSNNLILNNKNNISEKSVSHNIMDLKSSVKKEDTDDDDVVIVDCVLNKKSSRVSSVSLNKDKRTQVKMETTDSLKYSASKPNIKSENNIIDLSGMDDKDPSNSNSSEIFSRNDNVTLKDLKLYEVARKNLPDGMYQELIPPIQSQDSEKDSINVKHLLESFKKEFQIYQEIIQTEANVEKSLKTLETYQAEKLRNIRTLIQKVVEDKQCLGKENNSKTDEFIKSCKTQGVSKLEPSEKLKISSECSSKGIRQDFKNYSQEALSMANVTDSFLPKFSIATSVSSQSNVLYANVDRDVKPDLAVLNNIPESVLIHHSTVRPKMEPTSIQELPNASAIKLLGERCNVCDKEAMAACQKCAKVFFCSNECGKKYWIDGHEKECGK